MKFDPSYHKLPDIYVRAGRNCYLDPIRMKLIYITPEETVRQKLLQFLLEHEVPKDMISVEEHLSHYGINSKLRADIVIKGYVNEENVLEPVAIIECKAPHVAVDTNACEQVFQYADLLGADYVAVTNGIESVYFHFNQDKEQYESIAELPSYDDLISGRYTLLEQAEVPERIAFEKLGSDGISAYVGYDIGKSTSPALQAVMVNFWECLLDETYRFPAGKYGLFHVTEDLGVRILSYGNASGGAFSGPYRSFLLNYKNSTEIVSIGVSTYCTWAKPDMIKTSINIAVDNEKESHHSLQLVADENISVIKKSVMFRHHGRISIGNLGSGKREELLHFIGKIYPKIVCNDQLYLGELTHDRLWKLTDCDVMQLVENLISYALIRDEYRNDVKAKKKP